MYISGATMSSSDTAAFFQWCTSKVPAQDPSMLDDKTWLQALDIAPHTGHGGVQAWLPCYQLRGNGATTSSEMRNDGF